VWLLATTMWAVEVRSWLLVINGRGVWHWDNGEG
jgi:hypothetical protein